MGHSGYTVSRDTLSDAALLFFEHSLIQRIVLKILWVMAFMIVLLTSLKIALLGFRLSDFFHLALGLAWVFDWRRLLKKMFSFLLRRKIAASQYYGVALTETGLAWDNGGPAVLIPWSSMRFVLACPNGYIFPSGRIRYLWVPKEALTIEQTTYLISALNANHVPLKNLTKTCGLQPKK